MVGYQTEGGRKTHVFQDNKEGVTVLAVYVLLPALRFHCTRPHEPTATITMDNLKKIGGILDLVWAGDYMRAHKKLDEGEIRALPPSRPRPSAQRD
jgi:hypothetical protein